MGRHAYNSRCVGDGYSIEDVVEQIKSAMSPSAVVRTGANMTALDSSVFRDDGYGNQVRDRVVLECTGKHPKAEILSVIPKGDQIKPKKKAT
jgi:hypothetical protein